MESTTCDTTEDPKDLPSDEMKPGRSNSTVACNANTICTISTILVFIFIGVAIGLSISPDTRKLSLVIFLPLISVSFLSCLITMCWMGYNESNNAFIESTDFAIPEIKPSTSTKSCDSDNDDDDDEEGLANTSETKEENLITILVPEIQSFITNTQKSFEESRDFLISKIFRPAAEKCKPMTTATNTGLSVDDIYGSDVECCVDVHCLRDEYGAINLTGTYKLVHNENFESFLAVFKVPRVFCKAADKARPQHKYTHLKDTFRVQIDGIVKGDTTFQLNNGPPSTSYIRSHKFLDYASYLDDKVGIVIRKVYQPSSKHSHDCAAKEILVIRELSKNGKRMILTSKALDADGNEIAVAVQTFLRIECIEMGRRR